MRAIPAQNYFPVFEEFDAETVKGHVLAYDYYLDPETKTDRRLRIVELGRADRPEGPVFIYHYDGYSIGPLIETIDGETAGFWVWGDGESDYSTAVLTLCAEGMVMQTLLGQGLHQHLLPALQGPAGWMQALQAQGQERGRNYVASRG